MNNTLHIIILQLKQKYGKDREQAGDSQITCEDAYLLKPYKWL